MTFNRNKIALLSALVLALNVVGSAAFASEGSGEEPGKCPETAVTCTEHDDCSGIQGHPQCTICNPFPANPKTCLSYN